MNPIQDNATNSELTELGTHAAAATNLHHTRVTEEPVQIQPPVGGNPGPLDNRSHRFDNKKNGKPI